MNQDRMEIEGASLGVWRDASSWEGLRTAALGDFACDDAEAGATLLRDAARQMVVEGYQAVVGPMNGDTWSTHRLVVESDGRRPFLMEPTNPDHYPEAFRRAGWSEIGHYASAIGPLPSEPQVRESPSGITLMPFDPDQTEQELEALHKASLAAFSRGLLYRPLSFDRFVAMYQPVVPHLDPELVVMARDEAGVLQGFLFAVPDLANPSSNRAVILKTYASLRPGLGSVLARRFYERAAAAGYDQVIHALMHDDNLSARHSANLGAKVFRRYALWGQRL